MTITPRYTNALTVLPRKAARPEEAPAAADTFVPSAAAEPPSVVERTFRESFFEDYQARYCGQNIKHFLTKLPEAELEGAKVLGIENKGFSWFGMVRAMQARDTKGNGEPYVTDRNWYHHVVLEKDGKIFDFDYGIVPSTPGVQEYFDKMFFEKDDKVRPADKLKDYELQVIDAREYVKGDKDTSTKVRFAEYLGGWANQAKFTVTATR